MSERKTELIQTLNDSHQIVKNTFGKLEGGQWDIRVQDEDQQWTVRQVLAHIVDAQRGILGQIKRVNVGELPVPANFDLNRWNRRVIEKMADKTAEELFQTLEPDHAAVVETINGLTEADFDKAGDFGAMGIETIEQTIRRLARHGIEHSTVVLDKVK